MYIFPKDLYTDVRIEEMYDLWNNWKNKEIESDSMTKETGAIIRVYDGTMWYSCTTNNIDEIQKEIDNLATIATKNPDVYEDSMVMNFEVNNDTVICFDGDKDIRNITREQWLTLMNHYVDTCVDDTIEEIKATYVNVGASYKKKSFYSSKGASIVQDYQKGYLSAFYEITVDGVTTSGGKGYYEMFFDCLKDREAEIVAERDRFLDFARNAVPVEPGEYTCILSPVTTSMFVHESFGHKSEADFMLNDKTLQDEWVMGKVVGSELVSICDKGNLMNHGYVPYDDEGTKAGETWLIKNGKLTGRLHNAKSAAILNEPLTGSARAQNYYHVPIVRMTNTFMQGGETKPEEMIAEVKDGIYVYDVTFGTGQATFTLKPSIAYRIRDGKLCEPVRINVITGSVFETLFLIDAVGTDYKLFNTFTCGKGNQGAMVSAGGPSIRVKKLMVN